MISREAARLAKFKTGSWNRGTGGPTYILDNSYEAQDTNITLSNLK